MKRTLKERFWPKVDKSGECWLWTGAGDGHGYGQISAGMDVDHICHTRLCVRSLHLRVVDRKQNMENMSGATKANKTSGIRGVYWNKLRKKWAAQICHNRKTMYLGLYATKEEAAAVARAKRNELFTHNTADRVFQ